MRRVFLVRRLVVLTAVAVAVVVSALLVLRVPSIAGLKAERASVESTSMGQSDFLGPSYVVEPGDTLWAIARATQPDADPRDVVEQIIEMNQGSQVVGQSGALRSGLRLQLPVND